MERLLTQPFVITGQNPPHLSHPKYRPDIDGLRAIAVLSVVAFHAFPDWVKGGFVGVDVFFVISGYLISTIIFENLERGTFSFAEFYSRRIKRIFPALLLVLIASYAFGWFALLADEYKQLGKHIVAGAAFFSNIVLWNEAGYFSNSAETKPLLHLWSLGIEEQFYIIWPLLLWLAWKKKFDLLTIATLVAIASFYLNVIGINEDAVATFYSPQTRFWELVCGSLLAWVTLYENVAFCSYNATLNGWLASAVYREKPEGNGETLANVLSFAGAFILAYGVYRINKDLSFPGKWAVVPVLGAVLIISGGSKAWVNRHVLSNRLAVWFGLISFPLYLWHWPLLSFARIMEGEVPGRIVRLVAIILSIFLAWLTYRFIERPVRLGKCRGITGVALVLLMVVVGGVGYSTHKRDGLTFRNVVLKNADQEQKAVYKSNSGTGCVESMRYIDAKKWCAKYLAEGATKTIVLWGDSSAAAWLPVFQDVSKGLNYSLVNIAHPSCPPILGVWKTHFAFPASRDYCADGKMQREVLQLISRLTPDLVVVIGAWTSYSPYSNREFITDADIGEADRASTERAIRSRVPDTLRELGKLGKVVVFKSWPQLPDRPNYPVKRIEALQSGVNTVYTSVEEFKKDTALINEVFSEFKSDNMSFYDPSEKICGVERCGQMLNGMKLYRDTYHITPQGSLQFKDDVQRLLNQ